MYYQLLIHLFISLFAQYYVFNQNSIMPPSTIYASTMCIVVSVTTPINTSVLNEYITLEETLCTNRNQSQL